MTATKRTTNAELSKHFDTLSERVHAFIQSEKEARAQLNKTMNEILVTVQEMRVDVAVATNQRKTLKDEVDNLEKRVNNWSITNSIAAAIAMILGFFGINR